VLTVYGTIFIEPVEVLGLDFTVSREEKRGCTSPFAKMNYGRRYFDLQVPVVVGFASAPS